MIWCESWAIHSENVAVRTEQCHVSPSKTWTRLCGHSTNPPSMNTTQKSRKIRQKLGGVIVLLYFIYTLCNSSVTNPVISCCFELRMLLLEQDEQVATVFIGYIDTPGTGQKCRYMKKSIIAFSNVISDTRSTYEL